MKLNSKYLVLDNLTRYFIFTGGRASGKSFAINMMLLYLTFEAGHIILFTRYTLRSASISIIPEFIDKIKILEMEDLFHITKDEIINIQTGSKIVFRGIKTSSGDQTANLKSLQGITTFVLEEAEELTDESIFDKIDFSVRQRNMDNRIILILNPASKEHWIYKRFFEAKGVNAGSNMIKDDTTYVHTTYLDNVENLNQSYIKRIEQLKRDRPEKHKQIIMGSWLEKAEGVIYTDWSIGEFKEVGKIVLGQDYGFSADESTLIKVSIDKANKKIYAEECFFEKHLTTSQIADLNKKFAGNNLIIGDSAEPRLIKELSMHCNITPAIKGQGSITYGISLIQDYHLIVSESSINLIKELNNYRWLEKKSNTPIDAHNHLLDALRYCVSYQLANKHKGEYFIY